jgi:hypothetical protein
MNKEKKMNFYFKSTLGNQVWWASIIPAPGKPKQENFKFKTSLGYIASLRSAWAT